MLTNTDTNINRLILTCCLSRKTEALSLVGLTFDLPDIVLNTTCNYEIIHMKKNVKITMMLVNKRR